MRNLLYFFLAVMVVSCQEGGVRCDENPYVMDRLKSDIEAVKGRKLNFSPGEEEKAFKAYQRLAVIVEGEYDLDIISHDFHEKMLNEDTLDQRFRSWGRWLKNEGCRLQKSSIDSLFNEINISRERDLMRESYRIEKRRVINGIEIDDSSMDSVLDEKLRRGYEMSRIEW